jgi:hypothetical protein
MTKITLRTRQKKKKKKTKQKLDAILSWVPLNSNPGSVELSSINQSILDFIFDRPILICSKMWSHAIWIFAITNYVY